MIKTAEAGMQELNLFPLYTTREAYHQATGKEAPAFDHLKPPKYWEDPSALNSDLPEIVYERVPMLNSGSQYVSRNGQPVFKPIVLLKEIAATVNIPTREDEIRDAHEPDWITAPTPCPMRALEPGEVFVAHPFAGFVVRNLQLFTDQMSRADVFTAADRNLLKRIAEKVGA